MIPTIRKTIVSRIVGPQDIVVLFQSIQHLGMMHNYLHKPYESLHNCIEYSEIYADHPCYFSGYLPGCKLVRQAGASRKKVNRGRGYPAGNRGDRIVPGTPGETVTYYIYTSVPLQREGVGMAVTPAISKIAGDKYSWLCFPNIGFFMMDTSFSPPVLKALACPFPR